MNHWLNEPHKFLNKTNQPKKIRINSCPQSHDNDNRTKQTIFELLTLPRDLPRSVIQKAYIRPWDRLPSPKLQLQKVVNVTRSENRNDSKPANKITKYRNYLLILVDLKQRIYPITN